MMRLQQSGTGLGSDILLTVVVKDEATAQPLFRGLWAQINAFESRFSRFRTDSELSFVNQRAGVMTAISPEFHDMLQTARQYTKISGGLYSPLLLPALQRAGYVGSWPNAQHYDKQLDYRQRSATSAVASILLRKDSLHLPAETALDFGGIGKGYLLDKLADFLDSQKVHDYWLSLGGDLVFSGFDNERQPWKVGVADAKDIDRSATTIVNTDGRRLAVTTSGTTKRRGKDWHHIIDPRSGKPATTDVLTATVTHASATAADVYAKCLVILGAPLASDFIEQHEIRAALLQTRHTEVMRRYKFGDFA